MMRRQRLLFATQFSVMLVWATIGAGRHSVATSLIPAKRCGGLNRPMRGAVLDDSDMHARTDLDEADRVVLEPATYNEDLMLNEAQAYLVYTDDKRYFLPDRAGLTEKEATRLREIFVRGMPDR
jgi:hypothetical protein